MEREWMEYSKDRLNQQIRNLMRENSFMKESLYRKDKEMMELMKRLKTTEQVAVWMGIGGAIGLLIGFAAFLSVWGEVKP